MPRKRADKTLDECTIEDLLNELRERALAVAIGLAKVEDGGHVVERIVAKGPHVLLLGLSQMVATRIAIDANRAITPLPEEDDE